VGGRLRDLLSLFAFKYVAGIIYVCEARRREGLRGAELKIMTSRRVMPLPATLGCGLA
jgi:hypothetical protein